MEDQFTKRVKYSSYLYRYRDATARRSAAMEQVEEDLAPESSANVIPNNLNEDPAPIPFASNETEYNVGETEFESVETMEESGNEEFIVDYLPESSDDEPIDVERTNGYCVETALRRWAINTNQTYDSISQVMEIIHARTLLKTNTNASKNIVTINGSQYWYHGIRQCLLNNLRYVGNITDLQNQEASNNSFSPS
ncbi:uncharacterized protein LOC128298647 [Anopheles moucheti]|uniref:uncharacterized protein LOC128298647 n=1 Tax=Anopheles moucheti TaxID=186751 RepID=UPI0022F0CE86|nr:uncharacterized protein LOC128298647 [Anopheles moucheti]